MKKITMQPTVTSLQESFDSFIMECQVRNLSTQTIGIYKTHYRIFMSFYAHRDCLPGDIIHLLHGGKRGVAEGGVHAVIDQHALQIDVPAFVQCELAGQVEMVVRVIVGMEQVGLMDHRRHAVYPLIPHKSQGR